MAYPTAAPVLELPSGELIMDSLAIAEYLEKTYPGRPSLFFPGAQAPVDAASSHAKMAKALLALFAAGKLGPAFHASITRAGSAISRLRSMTREPVAWTVQA